MTNQLLDEIAWDDSRADEAEAAWQKLGLHLGFASIRPEKQYGTGTDNLWALSPTLRAVIELRTAAFNLVAKIANGVGAGAANCWPMLMSPCFASALSLGKGLLPP